MLNNSLIKNKKGQVLVEYTLIIFVCISFSTIFFAVRNSNEQTIAELLVTSLEDLFSLYSFILAVP